MGPTWVSPAHGDVATAEVLRHLIAVPFALIGLAAESYREPDATWWIRIVGVLFVVVATYWAVVGTG